MKIDWQKVGIKKLAATISAHLQKNDIEVVLVGGACVSGGVRGRFSFEHDICIIT